MSSTTMHASKVLNGIDVEGLQGLIDNVTGDPQKGQTSWGVVTRWAGGTVSKTQVSKFEIGGKKIEKDFQIRIDEPLELGGTNTAPNPQETLLAALNACMTVGYVAVSTLYGIKLSSLEIETKGDIDLRGFLGIDPRTPAGYEQLSYTVRIKGDGTPEQFAKIHEAVQATSPNYFNLSNAVPLKAKLVVE